MHALLADLLPWLAVFYALDGLAQLRRGHWLLVSSGAGPFRLRRAGLHHVGLSPLAEVVAAFDLPWLATPAALLLQDPGRRAERPFLEEADVTAVPWEGLAPEAEGKKVVSRGRRLLTAPHPALAARLAVRLAAVAAGTPADRMERLSVDRAAALDVAGARARRARQRPWRAGLRGLAVALAAVLFGGGALAVWGPPGAIEAEAVALGAGAALALEAGLAVGFLRAGGAGWGAALGGALGLAAWPVAALHPLVHLSRGGLAERDALAAAAVLLPPATLRELLASELGRVTAARARVSTGGALADALEVRERELRAVLAAAAIPVEDALAPPQLAAGEAAFCPICRTGFRAGTPTCRDCGVALIAATWRAAADRRQG